VAIVLEETGERKLTLTRWGLIPRWAKDSKIGNKLINARAETVREKPSFREAFQRRRCLVVADGFYEWRKVDRLKQPYYIRQKDDRPFAFAGLWESWRGEEETIRSSTIITTTANETVQPIHDRQPVILSPENYAPWLDPNAKPDALQSLLAPSESDRLKAFPVRPLVNSPARDSAELIEAIA
jgi:putative SOS response-associated peptidase YedK